MKFEDYEREHFQRYAEFAATVAHIIEKALAASDVPRPQSIQHRAKTPKSLKDRLSQTGKLNSDDIENDRRDLAGVRIIFYTDNDVNRFINTLLVADNFEVEREATRIHHPVPDNATGHYRALHHTVRLKESRAKLPEYARYAGMRCEIQIHTVLNHAWSETSHDILYKSDLRPGFGTRAMEQIKKRLDRIATKYLLPAGYEFQRVQHDYERLQQDKELFDTDVLTGLESATDNNDRFELITSLKEHVLPNYDDVPAIIGDVIEPLLAAVRKAKDTPTTTRSTPFGELEGRTAADIARLAVETLEMFRYADVTRTFDALRRIYVTLPDDRTRAQIQRTVEKLAEHNLDVWKQHGPAVEWILADTIEHLSEDDQETARALVVQVWSSLLHPEITGTTWRASSVTLHSGVLPVSNALQEVRTRAISGLFALFRSATSDVQRREAAHALWQATQTAVRGDLSNDFLKLTITDGNRIANFFATEAENLSFELRQFVERHYLFSYHRARELANDATDRFGCRSDAASLMQSILRFRDIANADEQFVRHKMLVGFETVLPEHWDDEDWNYQKVQAFRAAEGERYIAAIDADTETEWFAFIERCAATKSDDLATFPVFAAFLTSLARQKPEVTKRLLACASPDLMRFLAAMLQGLYEGDRAIWRETVDRCIAAKSNLVSLARHWRFAKLNEPDLIASVLDSAIAANDDGAVQHCILYALEHGPGNGVPPNAAFFDRSIQYATSKRLVHWVDEAWFAHDRIAFFDALTADEAKALLSAMSDVAVIESRAGWILTQVARKHLALVWDYFRTRLQRDKSADEPRVRFEAFPYAFHGLEKELSRDAPLAVSTVRGWYAEDSALFSYTGGRLLSIAFPGFGPEIAALFGELVANGSEADANFALAVLGNYNGDAATHEVLKQIVAKYPRNSEILGRVAGSLESTGGVHGEFGFVDAIRKKKEAVEPWLTDPRQTVQAFAEEYIRQADVRMADEQRRAEQRKALRELAYEPDDDETDDIKANASDSQAAGIDGEAGAVGTAGPRTGE